MADRVSYEAPKLEVLGSVHEITAGLGATGADTTLPVLNITGKVLDV